MTQYITAVKNIKIPDGLPVSRNIFLRYSQQFPNLKCLTSVFSNMIWTLYIYRRSNGFGQQSLGLALTLMLDEHPRDELEDAEDEGEDAAEGDMVRPGFVPEFKLNQIREAIDSGLVLFDVAIAGTSTSHSVYTSLGELLGEDTIRPRVTLMSAAASSSGKICIDCPLPAQICALYAAHSKWTRAQEIISISSPIAVPLQPIPRSSALQGSPRWKASSSLLAVAMGRIGRVDIGMPSHFFGNWSYLSK